MPADMTWKVGDTQPSFADILQYSDGTVPYLPGATVELRLRSLANASLQTLTGDVQVTDPNTGTVLFTPSAEDTAVAGNYLAEWFVTFAESTGLGQQTFPTDGYLWVSIEPNASTYTQKIVSLGSVKRYLNIQANDRSRDVELTELIDSIAPLIEAYVGPLVPKLYEEWFDGGSNVIALSYDPSVGFGSNPYINVVAASEFRGPIEYPLALIASPSLGSIYSIMVVPTRAAITRRSAGGATIAFMPGRDSIHIWYEAGQNPIPPQISHAALEYVRALYRYPQQIGSGSLAPGDRIEAAGVLQHELTRIMGTWLRPMKRFPSIA